MGIHIVLITNMAIILIFTFTLMLSERTTGKTKYSVNLVFYVKHYVRGVDTPPNDWFQVLTTLFVYLHTHTKSVLWPFVKGPFLFKHNCALVHKPRLMEDII